jgi:hypothetical protein
MTIKTSVINTFKRVGIDQTMAQAALDSTAKMTVTNRFSGETCEVNPLIYKLINWVYKTSNAYEQGDQTVKISDFDRIRYFILDIDPTAYNTCID